MKIAEQISSAYTEHGMGSDSLDFSATELSKHSQILDLRFLLSALTHSLCITSDFKFPTLPTIPSVLSHLLNNNWDKLLLNTLFLFWYRVFDGLSDHRFLCQCTAL